jgi:hypothetical protein
LNPHALAGTSPSSWRVCLFRHSDVVVLPDAELVDASASRTRPRAVVERSAPPPRRLRRPVHRSPLTGQLLPGTVFWLVGGTRTAQSWGNHSRLAPFGFGPTPDVYADQAIADGSAKSGRATICFHSRASACV